MNKTFIITFMLVLLVISCSKEPKYGKPDVSVNSIKDNFTDWWFYFNEKIVLSSEFIAVDVDNKEIDKESFLNKLSTGNYIPINLISKDSSTYYKLFSTENEKIKTTIKNISSNSYKYFLMEGKKFPDFQFIDLDRNHFNNKSTHGKIVLLKLWFINCTPCVAEMPELNRLIEKYKDRDDILFISLAFDSKENLIDFLNNHTFNYVVVPNQKSFIEDTLKISSFPTHFIIDKTGIIKKVVNSVEELKLGLKNTKILIKKPNKRLPPPPPTSKN